MLDKAHVLGMLRDLRNRDPSFTYFGARVHQYRLGPPLSEPEVARVESQYGFSLPPDYRYFIRDIGNGGAGPCYGLFPLGFQNGLRSLEPWDQVGLIGTPGRPFPHRDAWNLPPEFWAQEPDPPEGLPIEEEDRLNEEWEAKLAEHYWRSDLIDGAIPLVDMGCALTQWLVVSGSEAGMVWEDLRADYEGIRPLVGPSGNRVTFTDWYMSWLERGLAQLPAQPAAPSPQPQGTPAAVQSRSWWQRLLGR